MKEIYSLAIQFKRSNSYSLLQYRQPAVLEDHFSNTTFICDKTKFRSPHLLDVSWPYLQNHIKVSLGGPRDVPGERLQMMVGHAP